MSKRLSTTNMKELIEQEMAKAKAGNPLPEATPGDTNFSTSVIRLNVLTDVVAYEDNPRHKINEKYEDIKASIRARGIEQALYVTKRPGAAQWVLAKGGKTRWMILQDLAKEDEAKWLHHDFLVKPYSNESDLLASHLIENIQRSDMTFWDTAKGLMMMKVQMSKDLGLELNSKEFAAHLKGTGLETSTTALMNYQFAVDYYSMIGELAQNISYRDVHGVLRSQLKTLSALAEKFSQEHANEFDQQYRNWIETYCSFQTAYDLSLFQKHIHQNAAAYLGVAEDELTLMLEGYKHNKEATLEELRVPVAPAGGQTDGESGASWLPMGSGASDDGSTNDGAAGTEGSDDTPGIDQGLANLTRTLSGGGYGGSDDAAGRSAGLRGLKVSNGTGLTLKVRHTPAAGENLNAQGASQGTLGGMSPLESARLQVQASLHEFADTAGITAQLLSAPAMSLGYYMELTKPGMLGSTPDELPVQAWWFLANLSGQVDADLEATLDKVDQDGNFALPDTGPTGFRHALAVESVWLQAVAHILGGRPLIEASHGLSILTDAQHPLCEPALQLLNHIRTLRLYQSEAATLAALGDTGGVQ
jgi:ParB family protein of integrating conjugative element (PFGI_1 class)